ncbi:MULTISPECIES: gliding motility lipoprotein GldH [Arenibacter]|uniref:gliding motility lipoprotein GldH n=1 Tax=Arenibacter TaxID=178469 RepID=UPI001C07CFA6|nr:MULTISPECIES: gliding motility lipoprotein GldH [Arenibacter]MBU2904955.1 gliding motility lipoprotein GldH [Arenibacter algicola]MCK0132781.1 gliding motility lipoprotein GldH [Arenibacter sp. S6351L]
MLKSLGVFFLVIFMVSCDKQTIKSDYSPTQNGRWNKDSVVKFSFQELDTLQKYNMFINLRNDGTYPYSNLFLIAELKFPNGDMVRDTLEYEMAKPDGQWLGTGYGSLKENKLWYKENVVFPSSGVYTLEISHAMRKNGQVDGIVELEGITDVGYLIEKSNQ